MLKNPRRVESRPAACALALLVFLPAACLDKSERLDPRVDSESHFLRGCESSSECSDGRTCLCAICTKVCASDAECQANVSDDGREVACVAPGTRFACGAAASTPAAMCVATCEVPGDCGTGFDCKTGACVPTPPPPASSLGTPIEIPPGSAGRVEVSIAPLGDGSMATPVAHLSNACYDVWATDGNGALLWAEGDPAIAGDAGALCSDTFGNASAGDLTYIGPCNRNAGGPSKVWVVIDALWDDSDPSAMMDAGTTCTFAAPCTLEFTCSAEDVLVTFNIALQR